MKPAQENRKGRRGNTFCLGCGSTLRVQNPPPCDGVLLPGWCARPKCQPARQRFEAVADAIIKRYAGKD